MQARRVSRLIMCWCPRISRISSLVLLRRRASFSLLSYVFSFFLLEISLSSAILETFWKTHFYYRPLVLSHFNFIRIDIFYLPSYEEFYPDPDARSSEPGAFSRIITPQATTRVAGLLERSKGTIVFGGQVDKDNKYIAPTVVKDVGPEDSLMSE